MIRFTANPTSTMISKLQILLKTPLNIALALALLLSPLSAFAQKPPQPRQRPSASEATQRLMKMFSVDIQKTLSACADQGLVNLASGADQDGSVICGDGARGSSVQFNTYVSTLSDVLAAGGLVGLRTAMQADPKIKPEMIAAYLGSQDGVRTLRGLLKQGLTDINLVPQPSVDFLVDKVVQRLTPVLKDATVLGGLLGTGTQYSQVVQNFCSPPGMSIEQIKKIVPGLTSVQVYAICVQESGLAQEIL